MKQVFKKLGDALRYGLIYEILDASDNSEVHLYGAISYLYLNGYIQNKTATSIYDSMRLKKISNDNELKKIVKKISEKVFDDLRDSLELGFSYKSLEDFVEDLNKVSISYSYFVFGETLTEKSRCGMFLNEQTLYYIAMEDERTSLAKIKLVDLEQGVSLDMQAAKERLGYNYIKICGFDKGLRRVYLKGVGQEGLYHYYDMLTNLFVVCPAAFIDFKMNVPYVITNDGYFAMVQGDEVHKIRKYQTFEHYIARKNDFLVVPKDINTKAFLPYRVMFNGMVVSADAEACRRFIWKELEIVVKLQSLSWLFSKGLLDVNDISMPQKMTLDSIIGTFKNEISGDELCTNKSFILLESTFNILKGYISSDEDVTKLLYVLYDVNQQLNGEEMERFPSEKLYLRLKELNIRKNVELNKIFEKNDFEELKKLILDGKTNDNVNKEKDKEGLIGWFYLWESEMECHSFKRKYGTIVGNLIIGNPNIIGMKLDKVSGFVSYDCFEDCYYITCDRVLTPENQLTILCRFNLRDEEFYFTTQRKYDIEGEIEEDGTEEVLVKDAKMKKIGELIPGSCFEHGPITELLEPVEGIDLSGINIDVE